MVAGICSRGMGAAGEKQADFLESEVPVGGIGGIASGFCMAEEQVVYELFVLELLRQ